MSKKFLLPLVLFASAIFISGCIFDGNKNVNQTVRSDFIPKTNLPSGYTYLGIHETALDIGNFSLSAVEGVYRYNGEDLYVQVIKNDTPGALLSEYKLKYKDANYDPFEEVSVNGHKATKVKDYSVIKGEQKAHYTLIWANEKNLLIVGSSTEAQTVMTLATATGI